jgi:hypothetical protein
MTGRLEELQVLDIKFLYGCAKPTIAVLYQVGSRFLLDCGKSFNNSLVYMDA